MEGATPPFGAAGEPEAIRWRFTHQNYGRNLAVSAYEGHNPLKIIRRRSTVSSFSADHFYYNPSGKIAVFSAASYAHRVPSSIYLEIISSE